MRGGVREPGVADPVGGDNEVGGHGEVAEDAHSRLDAVGRARDDLGEAPHRDPAPSGLRGEELPVAQHVSQHGVGDVVGGQAKALDAQERLAVLQGADGALRHARVV